LYRGCT